VRRSDGCINCGEVREIAAHRLCYTCYRQAERARGRQRTSVDWHNPGVRREHKKLIRAFAAVIAGLSDLGVSRDDIITIREVIDPYLAPIAKFLALAAEPEKPQGQVNSELSTGKLFSVHTGPDIEGG
jgi:hypothetical protein